MNILKNMAVGAIMLIAACVLLFWAEGRAVKTAQSLKEGSSLVIDADASKIDTANEGKLVHVAGKLEPQDTPSDDALGIAAEGKVRLERRVEMFQWKEVTRETEQTDSNGKTVKTEVVDYQKDWSSSPIDSSRFKSANAPQNPPMSLRSKTFDLQLGKVGAFSVAGNEVAGLGRSEPVMLTEDDRANAEDGLGGARPLTLFNNMLVTSQNPGAPTIGDLRISFEVSSLDSVSLVGKQGGAALGPYQTSNGRDLFLAEAGIQTAAQMFKNAEDANVMLTWILRLAGFILMFIGSKLTLSLISDIGGVIPIIGPLLQAGTTLVALAFSLVLSSFVIALGWVFYRPLVALAVLAVGLAIAYGLAVLGKRGKPAVAPQTAA